MLFLGDGGLLLKALKVSSAQGLPVHGVVTSAPLPRLTLKTLTCPVTVVPDPNDAVDFVRAHATDGIVWSINNMKILRKDMLSLPGVRFFNVHNGLVQTYRGLPDVCIFFAVLDGVPEYGVTLHVIDDGVDSGPVIEQARFPIGPADTFATVMKRSLGECERTFDRNAARIAAGTWTAAPADLSRSRSYSYRTLREADSRRGEPAFARAADLGDYAMFFPRLDAWLRGDSPK